MPSTQLNSDKIETFFLSSEGRGIFRYISKYLFIPQFLAEPCLGRAAVDDRNLYCSYTFL